MAEVPSGPLTILFSDVEGSTDLRTERGDTVAHRILRSHEEVVRRCVAAHEGREVKALGDGFMVVFSSPRKALECAVAIELGLGERNLDAPGEEVQVRIGINTGEVVIEGDDVYGQAVNAAARIASRAKGGEILISEIVRQLVGSGPEFVFADRGRCRLKGFPDRWHLFALVYEGTAGAPPGSRLLLERAPFVGRDGERAELRSLIARTKAGTGAVVIVGGEPGVGKTRLAEELAVRCARDNFQTFIGHCYERGAQPYIPIVEALEQALSLAGSPDAFRDFLGQEAPEVSRLLPKLRRLYPDLPPPLDLPPEQERRYLFNSVCDVVDRAARLAPMLLVIDDAQWADEPTLLLLTHLAERVGEIPLLMVMLYRDIDLQSGSPLARALDELTRRRLARRIRLERLSRDGVAAMLAGLGRQEPPPGLVDILYGVAEGNPFFTEEVLNHLAERGQLFDGDGTFCSTVPVDDVDVPEGVRIAVGSRLGRLSDEASRLLGTAAVLGRAFSFRALQHMEEIPEDHLVDLIEEAERARLIVAVPDADEDRFRFAHELLRQTVLADLSALRRRRLHLRAADALEQVHADSPDQHAATVAHHLLEAGGAADPKRTFHYLLLAGAWAQETAAFEDALVHLEQAAERAELATPLQWAELLDRLGTARWNTGHQDEAIASWQQAIDAYEDAGDPERAGRVCQEGSYHLGWASRWGDAAAMVRRGTDLLGDQVSATTARLLAQQGNISAYGGAPFEEGDALITRALAVADKLADPVVRGHCLFGKAINRSAWMQLAETAEAGLEAAELLRAGHSLWEESAVLGFTHVALVMTGRFAEAEQVEVLLGPLAQRLGNTGALLQCRRARGITNFVQTGDVAGLEAFGVADLKMCVDAGLPWVNSSYSWLGTARFLAGDWDDARRHFEQAASCEPAGALHGLDEGLLFEYLAYAGRREEALALLDCAGDASLAVAGRPNTWGQWAMQCCVAEGLFVLGEYDRAAACYDAIADCLARTGVTFVNSADCRLLERAAGIAALAGERWDDAEGHLRTALQQAEALPQRPEQAHTRRFLSRMLHDRNRPGDGPEAVRLATEATELYRRMGMPRHLTMAEALQS